MAKTIMVQGTMSNAGKSLLAAGLCRIFWQDGYRVAPFKSQNMALNSFVTKEGLEMGRAQVMQAEAAGVLPSALMNPILLKPTSDVGSQVIVKGEAIGNMPAGEYFRYKKKLRPLVEEAFAELAAQYDIIVLEGAGSPAEINLKNEDFVNMGMAQIAKAPVLLAGDIDPGGVFAQLYGTVQLLPKAEQKYIKGLIINKFRGDASILRPGLASLEEMCGAPVLGVVPHMQLDLDDEDSLAPRLLKRPASRLLDIAVIRLPHLSNFTDFNALGRHPAMGLRYVQNAEELARPDLLILPGSKNTMADLRWLKEYGMAACIEALAAGGTPVIGVCGGYQMLGETLQDPYGAEGGGEMAGLKLLPLHTVFANEKTLTRTEGELAVKEGFFAPLCGTALTGYEIHMGKTQSNCPPACLFHTPGGPKPDGAAKGTILGSYLHGLFDSPAFTEGLAALLAKARGLSYTACTLQSLSEHNNAEYDKLAAGLRSALDMPKLYEILEAGI